MIPIVDELNSGSPDGHNSARVKTLFFRSAALMACIHRLSISSSIMVRYKAALEKCGWAAEIFRENAVLRQKHTPPWSSVSLSSVALKIIEIQSREEGVDSAAVLVIHKMMAEIVCTYKTVTLHVKDISAALIATGYINFQEDIQVCEQWLLYPNNRKPLREHVDAQPGNIYPFQLKRLKYRIDSLYSYFGRRGRMFYVANVQNHSDSDDSRKVKTFFDSELVLFNLGTMDFKLLGRLMIDLSFIMQSIEEEIRDMMDEFSAWRILVCAMALHPRMGRESPLMLLGDDLMKTIITIYSSE